MSGPRAHAPLLALLALALAACTNGDGTSPLPGPVVMSVAPDHLPPEGGTLTIAGERFFEVTHGTGFPRALTATVCGVRLHDLAVDGAERTLLAPPGHGVTIRLGDALTGTLPAHAEPTSTDVVVTRPDGATTKLEDAAVCQGDPPVNDAPAVTITEPADATRIEPGESVTFAATAHDAEDGDLTATVAWTSDLDGELGTGSTLTTSSLSIGNHTVSAIAVDANGASGSARVEVWVDGGFLDSGQDLPSGEEWWSDLAVGDLDGDGDLDAFIPSGTSSHALLNDGTGRFETHTVPHPSNVPAQRVALGDLDGDGDLDAYLVGISNYNRVVLLNDGAGTFTPNGQDLGRRDTWSDVVLGDVDGDGDLDAVVSSHSSSPGAVYLNDGSGRFTDSGQIVTSVTYAVTLGDVDGDRDPDVIAAASNSYVWTNDGSGGFPTWSHLGTGGSDVAVGDLDSDGDLDAFIGREWDGGTTAVYLNDGTGTFTGGELALDATATLGVALGDVDGDGDLDAVIANDDGQPNRVYLNDGSGGFDDRGQRLGTSSSSAVTLADFDGDGKLDAIVLNYDGPSRIYLRK